jgi:hypothetical protein
MDNKDVKKLEKNQTLLTYLIEIEDFIDNLDIYVFKNWIKGEIVNGPQIEKHWISIILKYNEDEKPDTTGALRLIKYGAKVRYKKAIEDVPVEIEDTDDYQDGTKKPKMEKKKIWLVELKVPKNLLIELDYEMDLYDDLDFDIETIEDAKEDGINKETMFKKTGEK